MALCARVPVIGNASPGKATSAASYHVALLSLFFWIRRRATASWARWCAFPDRRSNIPETTSKSFASCAFRIDFKRIRCLCRSCSRAKNAFVSFAAAACFKAAKKSTSASSHFSVSMRHVPRLSSALMFPGERSSASVHAISASWNASRFMRHTARLLYNAAPIASASRLVFARRRRSCFGRSVERERDRMLKPRERTHLRLLRGGHVRVHELRAHHGEHLHPRGVLDLRASRASFFQELIPEAFQRFAALELLLRRAAEGRSIQK
eukprot:31274-Pelagococcus_subviridis.AAC.10